MREHVVDSRNVTRHIEVARQEMLCPVSYVYRLMIRMAEPFFCSFLSLLQNKCQPLLVDGNAIKCNENRGCFYSAGNASSYSSFMVKHLKDFYSIFSHLLVLHRLTTVTGSRFPAVLAVPSKLANCMRLSRLPTFYEWKFSSAHISVSPGGRLLNCRSSCFPHDCVDASEHIFCPVSLSYQHRIPSS